MRTILRVAVLATVLALVPVVTATAAPETARVIVTLRPAVGGSATALTGADTTAAVTDAAFEIVEATGGKVGYVYSHALQGFSVELPAQAVAALQRHPRVLSVEPDVVVHATQTTPQPIPTGVDRVEGDLNPPTQSMEGIDIAILDTGVYIGTNPDGTARSHLDLNLKWVTDCSSAILYPMFGGCAYNGNHQDEHGHGTHVAGIAAACDNEIGSLGTAPCATLWSVKVLGADGSGYLGSILAGIDFVTANASSIEVANMSLGFEGTSAALDTAITNAVNAGIVFVVAAGNNGIDASGFSPASHPDVITVSALADFDGLPGGLGVATCRADQDDTLADFSNYGPLVDIAAPGVCIYSTYLDDGYTTFSGTSMASPAVAGAAARYLVEHGLNPSNRTDVLAVRSALIAGAMPQDSACGFTGDVDAYAEPLLFLNGSAFFGTGTCGGETPPPPTNQPPVASFASSCTDLTCSFTDTSSDTDGSIAGHLWDFGDETTATTPNPTHIYGAAGTYTVTLTVTDDDDAESARFEAQVTVTDPTPNQPPTASFTASCTDLTCVFTDTSSDTDGSIAGHLWDFGDETTATTPNPTHIYGAAGTYTVTLTVTDDDDAESARFEAQVTVTEPTGDVTVTAAVYPILVEGRDATIDVQILDASADGIEGVTVNGDWTYRDWRGRTRTTAASGVTGADGVVTYTLRLPRGGSVESFCLTSVVPPPGYVYQAPFFACGIPLT